MLKYSGSHLKVGQDQISSLVVQWEASSHWSWGLSPREHGGAHPQWMEYGSGYPGVVSVTSTGSGDGYVTNPEKLRHSDRALGPTAEYTGDDDVIVSHVTSGPIVSSK